MNKIANVRSVAAPTVEELVARTRELKPLLSKNGPLGETNRRVVEESIEAVRKAGLFKVCTPKRYGGWEMNTRAMLDVSSAVAEADGGTAWVVNLNNVCCWLTSLFPVKAQDEIFGVDPDVRISGVLNPTATVKKVDGGYRVTGQWHYNSGGWHSQWAVLGMPIVNDAGEPIDQGLGLFPMSDLEQVDTWFVAGMKSSGSISLKADNAFVPNHRVLSMPRAIEGDYPTEMRGQEALYRSPFIPLLAIILVGPILGLGRAALDFVRQKANSRTIAYTFFEKQSASVAFQLQVAEAAMMIDTAYFHAYRARRGRRYGGRARRLSGYADARAGAGRYRLCGRENHPGHRKAIVRARFRGLCRRQSAPAHLARCGCRVAARGGVAAGRL